MSRLRYSGIVLSVLGALAFLAGCSKPQEAERSFTVHGVIRGPFDPQERTVAIQHEAIPGYMPAMTMPFYTTAEEAAGLIPGDRVTFEFRVGETTSRATNFQKTGREDLSNAPPAAPRPSARSSRLREGDAVPAFSLVDQDGRPFSADRLRGRHTVLTFIFTRCPVPEFCPLIGRNFQALQRHLRDTPNLPTSESQLLSITIDPTYDRPPVLRAYGESLGADFDRWQFLTGSAPEIERLATLFAVHRDSNGASIDHTLATALIDPEGKVAAIWRGNAWQPEDIVAALTRQDSASAATGP